MFRNTFPIVCSKTVAYSYYFANGNGLNGGKYAYIHTHSHTLKQGQGRWEVTDEWVLKWSLCLV